MLCYLQDFGRKQCLIISATMIYSRCNKRIPTVLGNSFGILLYIRKQLIYARKLSTKIWKESRVSFSHCQLLSLLSRGVKKCKLIHNFPFKLFNFLNHFPYQLCQVHGTGRFLVLNDHTLSLDTSACVHTSISRRFTQYIEHLVEHLQLHSCNVHIKGYNYIRHVVYMLKSKDVQVNKFTQVKESLNGLRLTEVR